MASLNFHLFLLFSLLFISYSLAQTSTPPKALLLPIIKDSSLQYITHINQRTPSVSISLTLDLGGQFLWTDCQNGYVSSTYHSGGCHTAQCKLAGASSDCETCHSTPGPGCTNTSTCWHFPENTVTQQATNAELASDVVSVESTDGKNPGQVISVPQFLFLCAPTFLLQGLASGVTGMAGLGRTQISLSSQFATDFGFKKQFALCLSSSTKSNGFAILGDGPYAIAPYADASTFLDYTPLILNKVNTQVPIRKSDRSPEYYVSVENITINGKVVPINSTLLTINKKGYFGTKISTVNPYTVLETSIFNAVNEVFTEQLELSYNVTKVDPVAPFGACFASKDIQSTQAGPNVPSIDLVMKGHYDWRIFGANSLVQVNDEVICLAFVDGGVGPQITSIVIGGYQIEDNLLVFDLEKKRLGFTASLLYLTTSCANFNFTSIA